MSTLGRKVWCRNPQASAEWASSRPWTSATTFAWSYWQAASLSLGPTLGKCFPAGSGVTLCWLGVLRLRAPNKPKSNLKHSSNKVDEDKPWRRSCSFPSGSWLWLDISFADFCCLIFFSPWLLFFFFSVCIRKMTKASPSHFTGHYTSLLFHSKRHGKAGWTSFLASNVRNVVKWKVS